MKRFASVLTVTALLCVMVAVCLPTVSAAPTFSIDRTVYGADDTITVTYNGTDTNDWTGIYPKGILPGSGQNSITWQYTVGSGSVTFAASELGGAGDYTVYLCDNDGYKVLESAAFAVRGTDTTDYGAKAATVQATVTKGKSTLSVTVTPSSAASLTYRLYWAKNGVRLQDYLPVKEVTHSGASAFEIVCNDCLFMPAEADSIEVAVVEGYSSSCFVAAPSKLKAPASTYRYSFQVLTDLHASASLPAHIPNLKQALRDVAKNGQNSIGIFTAGDNTDRGQQDQYDLLLKTINEIKNEVTLPPITFAIGNHDEVYGGTYAEEVERFIDNFKTPGLYYAVERNGNKFLILGSEEQSTAGTLSDTQLAWVEAELAETAPDQPVFLFLHQPLKDTVSGTLSQKNSTIQRWYLGEEASRKLHAVLKNYPNAVLFSGHTHSSFEQEQPLLYGNGADATFVNAASTAYLWGDDNLDFQGSQGLYVEVYEDYILVKGRDFIQSKWCGVAQFLIPLSTYNADPCEGDLIGDAADWSFDSSVMQVTSDNVATTFYNTDGQWPKADRVLTTPITFDPDETTLYIDMILEHTASANLYLQSKNGAAVSLSPYIPKTEIADASGDLIGNGKRVRGTVDMAKVAIPAEMFNTDGTVSVACVRVFASGEANAELRVYDLSLVNDHSEKAISLMNADTVQVADNTKNGSFSYQNGKLTVTADTADGYAVHFKLNESYNVSLLRQLLIKAQAGTRFDVSVVVSTNAADTAFSLADDFWPLLCDAKDNGFLPAGNYEKALDFYSCYTYNNLQTADGLSTVKTVTVTVGGAGTVVIDGLQLSSGSSLQTLPDDAAASGKTVAVTGDVNGDGEMDTVDVRLVLKHALGQELSEAQKAVADVDGDGNVTTMDVRSMLRALMV